MSSDLKVGRSIEGVLGPVGPLVGGVMLTQAALDHLVACGGAVIFIGSVHSQRAFPGASPYADRVQTGVLVDAAPVRRGCFGGAVFG